jgi:hypothetical protein
MINEPIQKMKRRSYHFSIQKGIVKLWISFQQLAPQERRIGYMLEQSHVNWVRGVVWQRQGLDLSHGG